MNETNIDWNLIKNLDPIKIKQNKDSKSIHAIIRSIGSSFISSDQTVFRNNPLTPRLIQLLQLAIEYLMLFQKRLAKNIESRKNEYESLKKKFQKVDQLYRQTLVINENLRKPREVCPACGKKFKIGYLDQHFRLRHHELIEPWIQIRSKSTVSQFSNDKAIIDEISAIQKAKDKSNKYEINKCNSIQISPKKSKPSINEPKSQLKSEDQISLNQGQLDQMVDEISKRISEHIQINKDSKNTENKSESQNKKNIQKNKARQNNQKSNSHPPHQIQQFNIDARRHDQSQSHRDYIQNTNINMNDEENFDPEINDKANQYASSLKKNSGNRVAFDPSAIENHCGSRRKNINKYENNEYEYDDNDEYANDNNDNNSPNQQINQNFQDQEISANELDDFIMGSSEIAMSNHQSNTKQQQQQPKTQPVQSNTKQQQQQQQKPKTQPIQSNNSQNQRKKIENKDSDNFKEDFDDFMMDSGETPQSNTNSKVPLKSQPIQQQQQKTKSQPAQPNYSQNQQNYDDNQKDGDYREDFDNFMLESSEIATSNQQKQKQETKEQIQQVPKDQSPKQMMNQKQKEQLLLQQTSSSPYQMKNSPNQSHETYQEGFDDFMMGSSGIPSTSIQDSGQKTPQKVSRKFKDSPPQSPAGIPYFPSSASFIPSPLGSPAHHSSSGSFPPSPSSFSPAVRKQQQQAQKHSNSEFEFTDEAPKMNQNTKNLNQKQSSKYEDNELNEYMINAQKKPPLKQLPKPPKRNILPNDQSNYVAITNNELDELIQESSSIIDDKEANSKKMKSKNNNKNIAKNTFTSKQTNFTNDDLDALIPESSSLIEEKKNLPKIQKQPAKKNVKNNKKQLYDEDKDFYNNSNKMQVPPQFAHYSPSELEVILAEESSAMDNKAPPKIDYSKPKPDYQNDQDDYYYYYQQESRKSNNNSYRGDLYDDYPDENNYDDKYNYEDKFYNDDKYYNDDKLYNDKPYDNSRSNNYYSKQNASNQNFKADDYNTYNSGSFEEDMRNNKHQNFEYDDKFNKDKSQQDSHEKISKPPMSIAEARKMAKKKQKSQQITTIGGVEFTDSQLAGFL